MSEYNKKELDGSQEFVDFILELIDVYKKIDEHVKIINIFDLLMAKITFILGVQRHLITSGIASHGDKEKHFLKRITEVSESFSEFEKLDRSSPITYSDYLKMRQAGKKKTENNLETEKTIHLKEDINNLKLFLSRKYKEPSSPLGVSGQLSTIGMFYIYLLDIQSIPTYLLAKIDFITARLVWAAASYIKEIEGTEATDHRLIKAKKKKQRKKFDRVQMVLEEYIRINKREELKPHRIAIIIRDRIKKKGKEAPSINTIKNYLKEEGYF